MRYILAADSPADARFVGAQILALGGHMRILQDAKGAFPVLVEPLSLPQSEMDELLGWCDATGRWVGEACDPGPAGSVAEALLRLAAGRDVGGLKSRTLRGIGAR